jgi:hypothetical protein
MLRSESIVPSLINFLKHEMCLLDIHTFILFQEASLVSCLQAVERLKIKTNIFV